MPNARSAVVDEEKVTSYLLSDSHPAGRAKAAFFRRFGFAVSYWETLRDALLAQLQSGEVASVTETEFGTKYVVPRLVTAYPAHGGEDDQGTGSRCPDGTPSGEWSGSR